MKMGEDPLIGFASFFKLSNPLLDILNEKGISLLSRVKKLEGSNLRNRPWMYATNLEIPRHLQMDWSSIDGVVKLHFNSTCMLISAH